MKTERAYVCDGHGCKKNCGDTMTPDEWKRYECHHTLDQNHAKNKIARKRKWEFKHEKMFEIE